jgi:hypothetical protein
VPERVGGAGSRPRERLAERATDPALPGTPQATRIGRWTSRTAQTAVTPRAPAVPRGRAGADVLGGPGRGAAPPVDPTAAAPPAAGRDPRGVAALTDRSVPTGARARAGEQVARTTARRGTTVHRARTAQPATVAPRVTTGPSVRTDRRAVAAPTGLRRRDPHRAGPLSAARAVPGSRDPGMSGRPGPVRPGATDRTAGAAQTLVGVPPTGAVGPAGTTAARPAATSHHVPAWPVEPTSRRSPKASTPGSCTARRGRSSAGCPRSWPRSWPPTSSSPGR